MPFSTSEKIRIINLMAGYNGLPLARRLQRYPYAPTILVTLFSISPVISNVTFGRVSRIVFFGSLWLRVTCLDWVSALTLVPYSLFATRLDPA
ncbi:hypothetical protein F5B20DRAFT_184405 [Whalleya microplaca]|nr:hypothetical protein F5B20DRAFT_184405 [Whalleya microplaca]